ncbi:MAG: NAD(P)/FAD-dependent oxidoreductase [Anaerolineae bacterium]|uniref:phytoene desaturase family protein n=1 Tax=Candidatus Amarolinea dominans TaxID=3140696 RepID=UPI003134CC91|nr:NAD(P)/FAD-dependent oxidoreductase [Anaerolineae bacterium]MBK9233869.1 NAD(P)/FAD-dependent oxidoreductase [Anaerolineae bacterium]
MTSVGTVAIIGGGVAGLAAGGLLARSGIKVKLFEANGKIGGCCATTTVAGYTFNDGALYLALPTMLDHVFARIGLDRPSALPLRKISAPQTTVLPNGDVVTFGDGLRVTVEKRTGTVNEAVLKQELDAMMSRWEPALRLLTEDILAHPLSFRRILARGWRHLPKFRGTVADELKRLFSDDSVRAAMAGVLLYTGLPPERQPAIGVLGLVTLFSDGFHLPEGGMGSVPEALSRALLAHGGEIHVNARVDRIVVRDGRVRGLEIRGQGPVDVDAVISTVSGMLTFGALLGDADSPRRLQRMAREAKLSHSAFSVQLGLRNRIDAPSHSHCFLPPMERQGEVFTPCDDGVKWLVYDAPTVTLPELAPAGGSVIELYPPVRRDLPVDAWSEERKEAVLARAVEALGRVHTLDIAVKRLVSPKDFRDNLNLYRGAVYGLSPEVAPWNHFPHRTPLRGLYQSGQTTYPGYSVARSAMAGILAAEALLAD